MKIIKYCEAKFNLAITKSLQIGTLDYYRKIDNKFVADAYEGFGAHTFHAINSEIILPQKDVAALTQGGLICKQMTINPGGQFIGDFLSPNVYIFCCSLAEEGNQSDAARFNYDSFYEISDPDLFLHKIGEGMPSKARLKGPKPNAVEIIFLHGAVQYQDTREHTHATNRSLSDLMIMNLFTKPKISPSDPEIRFQQNQEYRFAWIFVEEKTKQILEVEEDPILLTEIGSIKEACRF